MEQTRSESLRVAIEIYDDHDPFLDILAHIILENSLAFPWLGRRAEEEGWLKEKERLISALRSRAFSFFLLKSHVPLSLVCLINTHSSFYSCKVVIILINFNKYPS